MLPRYDDAIGRAFQNLPYTVIEPRGGSIQRPVDLTPVQPTSPVLLRLEDIQQELLDLAR